MPLNVLVALQQHFDLLDAAGPLEVLAHAKISLSASESSSSDRAPGFTFQTCGPPTLSNGLPVHPDLTFSEAYTRLTDFDIMIVPGGDCRNICANRLEPIPLLAAFADLAKQDPSRRRVIMSVCTGATFLAKAGLLRGRKGTTHPNYRDLFAEVCERQTEIREERWVVNKPKQGKLGLWVITAGGVTTGIDAALGLVDDLVGRQEAERVAELLQYRWHEEVYVNVYD